MSAATELPPAHRPGPEAWKHMVLNEARMVIRDTAGLVVPIGIPMLIMVMNGLGASGEPVPELGGLSPMSAIMMPLTLAMVIALVSVVNMPSFLATYRKTRILRRLAVTPAHPTMVLLAQMIVSLVQVVLGGGLAVLIAVLAFDISAPRNLAAAIGIGALAIASLYAVGMLVAALSPTVNSAVAIGLVAFFAMMALGGGFGPMVDLPDVLSTIGVWLPYGAAVEALGAAWIGQSIETAHLVAMGAWAVIGGGLAAKLFRWQ